MSCQNVRTVFGEAQGGLQKALSRMAGQNTSHHYQKSSQENQKQRHTRRPLRHIHEYRELPSQLVIYVQIKKPKAKLQNFTTELLSWHTSQGSHAGQNLWHCMAWEKTNWCRAALQCCTRKQSARCSASYSSFMTGSLFSQSEHRLYCLSLFADLLSKKLRVRIHNCIGGSNKGDIEGCLGFIAFHKLLCCAKIQNIHISNSLLREREETQGSKHGNSTASCK